MKKIIIIIAILMILLMAGILVLCYKYTDNTTLQLTTYQITHEQIPAEFDGFRIAQVSDLHNTEFGENNTDLITMLMESDADIIVFTGDQLDANHTDWGVVLQMVRQAVEIAPCYLVTGNHEGSLPEMREFLDQLTAAGVNVLDNEVTELTHNGATIDLVGLTDATMLRQYYSLGPETSLELTLQELSLDEERYTILLTHRPEYFDIYEENNADLSLCGHIHGGQIRIKDTGLIGPGKKLFPQYTGGVYTQNGASMVVSRGLGNSLFPWRINNPPEVVIIELNIDA